MCFSKQKVYIVAIKACMLKLKKILRTYRYTLYPNQTQQVLLAKHFGCVRYVYNHFLQERKRQYDVHKKSDNYHAQALALTALKKRTETSWLKEVNSQSLQYALQCLETAFQNFFQRGAGFPRFKSRRHKNSFRIPQFLSLRGDRLHIPKFKTGIKVKVHRALKGTIRHGVISKTATGRYQVCLLCEEEYQPKPKTGNACGLDLGLRDFVITSSGEKIRNHRYTSKYAGALKRAQQHLSRKLSSVTIDSPAFWLWF